IATVDHHAGNEWPLVLFTRKLPEHRKQASDEYAHDESCESSAPTSVFPDAVDDLCNAQAYDEVQVGIEVNQGGVDHRETRDGKQPAGATASAALQFEFLFHQ